MEINIQGGRPLRRGALEARHKTVPPEQGVSRRDLIAATRDAAMAFMLRPSVRLVLGELAGCYGEQRLARGLMIWPSNDYLVRKTGLSERAVRKAIRELIDLALLEPVDSANRKRFARRGEDGELLEVFGFNLSPIFVRRAEFAGMLLEHKLARDARTRAFDEITICRKAIEEALSALARVTGELSTPLHAELASLLSCTPKRRTGSVSTELVEAWRALRMAVEKAFYQETESGNGGISCRHIESNNDQSSDPCKVSTDERVVSLDLVIEACPALLDYGAPVVREQDLVQLATFLRSSIGAHENAWREAVETLGLMTAAILTVYVVQLHTDDVNGPGRIRNPGGLYRSLARKMVADEFDLVAALYALRRRHMG